MINASIVYEMIKVQTKWIVKWKACFRLFSAAIIISIFHLISIMKSNHRMRKIVNSEQIDHCRDNGSDRELHRLLEAPAARFNIILLVIIVILIFYHYHHHHRHWHYHHHFSGNIYLGTNSSSNIDAKKELLSSG